MVESFATDDGEPRESREKARSKQASILHSLRRLERLVHSSSGVSSANSDSSSASLRPPCSLFNRMALKT